MSINLTTGSFKTENMEAREDDLNEMSVRQDVLKDRNGKEDVLKETSRREDVLKERSGREDVWKERIPIPKKKAKSSNKTSQTNISEP